MRNETGHWDVIVVGGGPAGCALALSLGEKRRVLVLDRPPRSRGLLHGSDWRIGESLPAAAAVLMRRHGLFQRFLDDGHCERGASVSVWDAEDPMWFDPLRDPNGPGWHLDRSRFDRMLRTAAQDAGAVFAPTHGHLKPRREGDVWRLHDPTDETSLTSDVLVDATGRAANMCRSLGLNRVSSDRLVCAHTSVLIPNDIDRCTRICADTDGWWYSVRVPSGRRILAFHYDADDSASLSLRDSAALVERARRLPLLREVLQGNHAPERVHIQPANSVATDVSAAFERPNFYLIGDSILSFDPIASQGLFHALASAESAAAAIEATFVGDGGARRYFTNEMREVQSRYQTQVAAVYRGPTRFRQSRFWARRRGIG